LSTAHGESPSGKQLSWKTVIGGWSRDSAQAGNEPTRPAQRPSRGQASALDNSYAFNQPIADSQQPADRFMARPPMCGIRRFTPGIRAITMGTTSIGRDTKMKKGTPNKTISKVKRGFFRSAATSRRTA
jgi:hypothetical protein